MNKTPKQILDNIRVIETGNLPNLDVSNVLRSHKCIQWLKMAYPKHIDRLAWLINTVTLKERFRVCAPLFHALQGIPYAVIKGAVLSQIAYGDATLRTSGDIDLLISRSNLEDVKSLLWQNGFIQGRVGEKGIQPFSRRELIFQTTMSHQTAPFIKQTENPLVPFVSIDINWNIFWGESDYKADMDSFLQHTTNMTLFDIQMQTLTPIYAFLSLCMHHYKDMNSLYLLSERGIHMDQLCDILYFLKATTPDISTLIEVAQKYNVIQYLHYCIYYAHQLCPHPVLKLYLQSLDEVTPIDLTGYYGLTEDERQPWIIPFEERLLDPEFPQRFFAQLTDFQKEKVNLNRMYM